jgi:hypothetical protein
LRLALLLGDVNARHERCGGLNEVDLAEGVAKLSTSRFGTTSAQSDVGGARKHPD